MTFLGERLFGLLGIVVFLALAFILSRNRKAIEKRTVFVGLALQVALAIVVLKTAPGQWVFDTLSKGVTQLLSFTNAGTRVLFGPKIVDEQVLGVVFVFQVLPTVVFISAFFTLLYYFGVLQAIVKAMAWVMMRLMRVSGAESLNSAANVFMGQTEAPLIVKPYIGSMTMSELLCMMIAGMATIAGGIMAAYIGMGIEAKALLTASAMSAPGAIVIAKILMPETGDPLTRGVVRVDIPKTDVNFVDALARGASEGMRLAANIAAMLIAFLAMVALIDAILSSLSDGLTLTKIFGYVFSPVAYLIGIPAADTREVASLLGTKLVLNEFVAYANLIDVQKANAISVRSQEIATFALCGFANVGSIGIQIGGIGSLAPERRGDLARLSFLALFGGFTASLLNAAIASVLL
jgi:CNT family concentrative nucleoside transporter